jgi:hypothetical protein
MFKRPIGGFISLFFQKFQFKAYFGDALTNEHLSELTDPDHATRQWL